MLYWGGVVAFAQQTDFNLIAPKTQVALIKLEPYINLEVPLEYNNIGTVPVTLGVSANEETWNSLGNTVEVPAQSTITFTISQLSNETEGYLVAYNSNHLLSGIGAFESPELQILCPGISGPDISLEADAPGAWNSEINLLWSCPKTQVGIGTDQPSGFK